MGCGYTCCGVVFALAVFASASVTSDRTLHCVAPLEGGPGENCYATERIPSGATHTYVYDMTKVDRNADVRVSVSGIGLEVAVGDDNPSTVLVGSDIVRSRRQFESATSISVKSPAYSSEYVITVTAVQRLTALAEEDAAALQEIASGGECCTAPGSCSILRDWFGRDRRATDLCYQGTNLCDERGHIVSLDLSHQDLGCTSMPRALRRLPALRALDMTGTRLSAKVEDVASMVTELGKLERLRLDHNDVLGSLTCDLLGVRMTELDLAGNRIYGSIPACFTASPSLLRLRLSHNAILGRIPAPSDACALRELLLDHMGLSGATPDFSPARELALFDVAHNRLDAPPPALPPFVRAVRVAGNPFAASLQSGDVEMPAMLESGDVSVLEHATAAEARVGVSTDSLATAGEALLAAVVERHQPTDARNGGPGGRRDQSAGAWSLVAAGTALAAAIAMALALVATLVRNAIAAHADLGKRVAAGGEVCESPAVTATEAEPEPIGSAPEASEEASMCEGASRSGSQTIEPAASPVTELPASVLVHRLVRKASCGSSEGEDQVVCPGEHVSRKISNRSDVSDGIYADLDDGIEDDGGRIRAWVKDPLDKKDD